MSICGTSTARRVNVLVNVWETIGMQPQLISKEIRSNRGTAINTSLLLHKLEYLFYCVIAAETMNIFGLDKYDLILICLLLISHFKARKLVKVFTSYSISGVFPPYKSS